MNWGRVLAGVMLLAALTMPAMAAPLFPDVPENHWASDAVRSLAARGLVEGYPDGTFKGDRAATRWEVAMVVARLLAKMEQEHTTFATKAELDELRRLTEALREELAALGSGSPTSSRPRVAWTRGFPSWSGSATTEGCTPSA